METDVSKAVIEYLPAKRKSEGLIRPVSPCESGKGLPYAPVDWPNPGDIWGWSVGSIVKTSGFYQSRFLYAPKRLQEKPTRQLFFQSKISVTRYLQSVFPEADIAEFFASFTWEIPAKVQFRKKVKCSPSPHSLPSEGGAGKLERGDGVFNRTRKVALGKQSCKSSGQCIKPLALDAASAEETSASCVNAKALGGTQLSDSHAAISPDGNSPVDIKPEDLNPFSESQAGLIPEDFDSFLNSLDEVLYLPFPKPETCCSTSSQIEGMTETRSKLSSLLAMGFANLCASNKLNELIYLASKLQTDPTLSPGQLSMLKLIQEIPMSSNIFLQAKELSGKADKFFSDLDAKLSYVSSLKEEYSLEKEQLEISQADEASTLLTILEIDEEIATLQSRRAALNQNVEVTNRKIIQHSSNLKKVAECLPKIVHEVQVANSEKQEWELRKKISAEQVSEILAKFAPLKGFSF